MKFGDLPWSDSLNDNNPACSSTIISNVLINYIGATDHASHVSMSCRMSLN